MPRTRGLESTGQGSMQPMMVRSLAEAIALALEHPNA